MTRTGLMIAAALTLAACGQADGPRITAKIETDSPATASRPALPPRSAQPPVRPLVASGAAQAVPAVEGQEVQSFAWVVRVDPLKAQGPSTVKLFGTGGGDPAMNGLYSHIAFYEGADTGWKVFRIGDFLDYRVLSERSGRVDLEVTESVQQGAAGDIGSRKRSLIVGWATTGNAPSPVSVTVTPAR